MFAAIVLLKEKLPFPAIVACILVNLMRQEGSGGKSGLGGESGPWDPHRPGGSGLLRGILQEGPPCLTTKLAGIASFRPVLLSSGSTGAVCKVTGDKVFAGCPRVSRVRRMGTGKNLRLRQEKRVT